MNTQNIVAKVKKENYSGVIVALRLPKENAQRLFSGIGKGDYKSVAADKYHITLAYLGDSSELEGIKQNVLDVVKTFADNELHPVATYNGIGRFKEIEEDGNQAVYVSINNSKLNHFRDSLTAQLVDNGIDYSKEYGFIPHITLFYTKPDNSTPLIQLPDEEINFENISVMWGDEIFDFPLHSRGFKIGKRLAQTQVNKLKDVISLLLDVIGYVNYEDEVERMLDEVEQENKQATRGDLAAIRQEREARQPPSAAGGGANWTAGVGQVIIGNLARGEGGRFVSAANIAKMTNTLEQENISPAMFEAMQALLNGQPVAANMLSKLVAVGLATAQGQATQKAAGVLNAMKTGDPDKLKAAFKPAKGGGGGTGGKPSKEQIAEENINKVGKQLIEQNRLTAEQLNLLKRFALGQPVDEDSLQALVDLGIIELDDADNFSFSSIGDKFFNALEKGDLRKALDNLNKGESNIAKEIEAARLAEQEGLNEEQQAKDEVQRITEMKNEFIKRSGFDAIDTFVDFINGKTAAFDFSTLGLTELDAAGRQITTSFGKRLASAIANGDLRDALDAYRKAVLEASTEKSVSFGFKVLEGQNDDWCLTWTTNAYVDREQEAFTLKSIEDYVARNVDNEDKGNHWFWHIPGTEFTDIELQLVAGKFLVELAKFRKDEVGQAFKEFFLMYPGGHKEIAPDGWGCSQGFVYQKQDRQDGIYEWFDKKESTVLPIGEAANLFTLAEFDIGVKNMELSDKQKRALETVENDTKRTGLLQKILSIGKKRTAELDAAGIESKQAVVKTEDGNEYPAKCYAYVPDAEKPSAWKLRMCAVGTTEITREQLGAAAAAFSPGGFRGQKVQLPSADVAKVKRKLVSEYRKLDVANEDIPESIKALMEESAMDELLQKLAQASKSMHEDMRKRMDEVLTAMEDKEADQMGLVRQLAEIVEQIQDAELKTVLMEIVTAMQEMLKPTEEVEEEVVVTEAETEKELDVAKLVKALQLEKLNEMLEAHTKAIASNAENLEAVATLVKAIEELVEKNKALFERVAALETKTETVVEQTKELAKEDDKKVAEKQARYVPFWANRYEASKAAETVLSEDEAKEFSKPEMPDIINRMRNKIMGGK